MKTAIGIWVVASALLIAAIVTSGRKLPARALPRTNPRVHELQTRVQDLETEENALASRRLDEPHASQAPVARPDVDLTDLDDDARRMILLLRNMSDSTDMSKAKERMERAVKFLKDLTPEEQAALAQALEGPYRKISTRRYAAYGIVAAGKAATDEEILRAYHLHHQETREMAVREYKEALVGVVGESRTGTMPMMDQFLPVLQTGETALLEQAGPAAVHAFSAAISETFQREIAAGRMGRDDRGSLLATAAGVEAYKQAFAQVRPMVAPDRLQSFDLAVKGWPESAVLQIRQLTDIIKGLRRYQAK